MVQYSYSSILFGGKSESYFNGEVSKGLIAPNGIGYSKARGSFTSSAKISHALKALDLVYKKAVNVICTQSLSYMEVFVNGKKAAAVLYDSTMNTATVDNPTGSIKLGESYIKNEMLALIAIVLFNTKRSKELSDYAQRILASPSAHDNCFKFCDAFYYGTAKKDQSFQAIEGSIPSSSDFSSFSYIDAFKDIQHTLPELSVNFSKKKQTAKKEANPETEEEFKRIKMGEYIIPYEWSDEQKEKITPLSYLDGYVPCDAFFSILRKIKRKSGKILERLKAGGSVSEVIGNDYINLFLVGKPGSGKTVLAYAISAATGIPVYTIVFSKDTDEDEFEGKTRIVDGKAQFVETDFLKAYKNGGIVVLEEVNLANPAVVMGALGQSIEFPFVLKENGYKTVNRNPMFFVFSTMNVGTNGSNCLNQAFSNRHRQDYILNDPEKDAFINILASKGYKKADCSKVYKVYDKITGYLRASTVDRGDICDTLSIRTCLGCLDNMEDGDEFFTAVRNSIVGKIAESDLEIAKDVEEQVLAYMK